MKRTLLLLASITLAMLLASGVALVAPKEQARAAFPGINGKIAFVRDSARDSQIFTINPNGTGLRKIPTRPQFDGTPSWSPDGKKIAFSGVLRGSLDIFVMRADGSGLRRITRSPAIDSSPSWSPNGKRIAFTRQRGEGGATSICESCIVTIRVDGTGMKRLTDTRSFVSDPAWSPNGKKIAYSKFTRTGGEIFKMNAADGSHKKNLTTTPRAQESEPDWSPDGTKIAFTSFTEAHGAFDRVFTMNADGTNQKNLTRRDGGWSPGWSPNGRKIVFASTHPNAPNFDVFVMKADGTKVERLTRTLADDWEPDWQPLPSTRAAVGEVSDISAKDLLGALRPTLLGLGAQGERIRASVQ